MEIGTISESHLTELVSLQKELIDEKSDIERMLEFLPVILKDSNYHLLGARVEGRLVGFLLGRPMLSYS